MLFNVEIMYINTAGKRDVAQLENVDLGTAAQWAANSPLLPTAREIILTPIEKSPIG